MVESHYPAPIFSLPLFIFFLGIVFENCVCALFMKSGDNHRQRIVKL